MMTERVKPSPEDLTLLPLNHPRRLERAMKKEDWIETHASGTLRKNVRIGMAGDTQYREERICYEFGWEFEMVPATRVTFNTAITEGDCSPVTEAGWHIERYLALQPFPEDEFECKYIIIDRGNDERTEGIGIVCKKTSARFVKEGYLVLAIIAEYHKGVGFSPANNPF